MHRLYRNANVYFMMLVRKPSRGLMLPNVRNDLYYHKLINAHIVERVLEIDQSFAVLDGYHPPLFEKGDRIYTLFGKLHSRFYRGVWHPCFIGADGNKAWRKHGVPHRIDGPAFIYVNGDMRWYIDGKPHRDENDEPALIYVD